MINYFDFPRIEENIFFNSVASLIKSFNTPLNPLLLEGTYRFQNVCHAIPSRKRGGCVSRRGV